MASAGVTCRLGLNKIATIGVKAIVAFVESLLGTGGLISK
jgi:hypothetical protein